MIRKKIFKNFSIKIGVLLTLIFVMTFLDFKIPPNSPRSVIDNPKFLKIVDRNKQPLNYNLGNRWNNYELISLDKVPPIIHKAFILSEDKRFFQHHGVDWLARMSALLSFVKNRKLRGASTITEQVVRLLNPRPRNLWSRWMETWEAYTLEKTWSKEEILEFYFNQVPYHARRNGIVQASRYYFGRDLSTLSTSEMLALVIMVRSPSYLDPRINPQAIISRMTNFLNKISLSQSEKASVLWTIQHGFNIKNPPVLAIEAPHFINWIRKQDKLRERNFHLNAIIETTMDSRVQIFSQNILNEQLRVLKNSRAEHGAILVANHQTGEILAWIVGGNTDIDAVQTPRQPGSTIKPFLYSRALEKGWNAATIINDEPLLTKTGQGAHAIRNYSRINYGPITLRQALGNSLNVPAVKTTQFIGSDDLLSMLKKIGFSSLKQSSSFYGEGLGLGAAEVSLFELVQSYTLFPNQGRVRHLIGFKDQISELGEQVIDPRVTSLISDILMDPKARLLEFGRSSILNFHTPTSIKTGTSTDYRDAWAVAFNSKFIAGVWIGNLNRRSTHEITGAKVPAFLVRSILNDLEKIDPSPLSRLPLHKDLITKSICQSEGYVKLADNSCNSYTEYFLSESQNINQMVFENGNYPKLSFPSVGMLVAIDPRIPINDQVMNFRVDNLKNVDIVKWKLDGVYIGKSNGGIFPWKIERGKHYLKAEVKSVRFGESVHNSIFIVK